MLVPDEQLSPSTGDEFNSLETPFLKLHLGRDGKVVLIPRGPSTDYHITLHPGWKSGYMDIHKKVEQPGEQPRYETLYKISHAELAARFEKVGQRLLPELLKLYRPITFGWLHHRGYGLAAGRYPKVSQLRKAGAGDGKRLNITSEVMGRLHIEPDYLEDVLDLEDSALPIMECRHGRWREVGLLLKHLQADGTYSLHWVRRKDFNRFLKLIEIEMCQVFGEFSLEGVV